MRKILLSTALLLLTAGVFFPRIVRAIRPQDTPFPGCVPYCDCSCYSGADWIVCLWNQSNCCGGSMPCASRSPGAKPAILTKGVKTCEPPKRYSKPVQALLVVTGWRRSQ